LPFPTLERMNHTNLRLKHRTPLDSAMFPRGSNLECEESMSDMAIWTKPLARQVLSDGA
jgi:hypothetical protein